MTTKAVFFILVAAAIAFWAGYNFNAWQYDDLCLDMGGGKNPGNAPICVIEVDVKTL